MIELLVVIGIIGVLASLLASLGIARFPSYVRRASQGAMSANLFAALAFDSSQSGVTTAQTGR